MIYRVIGVMSGSSLDGLDIAYCILEESGGKWNFEIAETSFYKYEFELKEKLKNATELSALDYQLLHTDYGHYTGKKINQFISEKDLHHKVHFIASHGHTTFHLPEKKMTHQLGDGAAIAAETTLPVITDLRALDVALGGQGAPLVPLGEKLLFAEHECFLNIGGIANISFHADKKVIGFDVCAANRVLNMLAEESGFEFDEDGNLAASGNINQSLLQQLNQQKYYDLSAPKSLANNFGTDVIYPLIKTFQISAEDCLRTYTGHVALQIKNAFDKLNVHDKKLLVTGGGALNKFLIQQLQQQLSTLNIQIFLPDEKIILYKEALIMALIGALRWREEPTVLHSVSGAIKSSIGGALWMGNDL